MVVVVMGAACAGKTTVGAGLARALGWRFVDADDLHPPANVQKMARGEPLTEEDRAPWLEGVRARIEQLIARGEDAVLACSALSARSRAALRVDGVRVRFAWLDAPRPLLEERLRARRGHFFPAALLDSQLGALEPPSDALRLNAAEPISALVAHIRAAWGL